MSKAILVMDMPERCRDCTFFREIDISKACCEITEAPYDKDLCRFIDVAFSCEKPDWCPLRPMPEKKETYTTFECHTNGSWTEGMKAGWNACIDAIGGGE